MGISTYHQRIYLFAGFVNSGNVNCHTTHHVSFLFIVLYCFNSLTSPRYHQSDNTHSVNPPFQPTLRTTWEPPRNISHSRFNPMKSPFPVVSYTGNRDVLGLIAWNHHFGTLVGLNPFTVTYCWWNSRKSPCFVGKTKSTNITHCRSEYQPYNVGPPG